MSPEFVHLRASKARSNPSRAVSRSPVSWAERLGRSVRPPSEDAPDWKSGVSITAAKGPSQGLSRGHVFQAGPVGAAEPALADLDARQRHRRKTGHAGTSRIGDRRQHPRCLGGITRPVRRKIALDLVRHRAQRIGRERNGPSVGVEQGFIGHVAASYGERIKMITPEAADTVPRRRRATGADRCR